jgi:hypothetical protein
LQQEKQQLTALVAAEKERAATLLNEMQVLSERAAEAERELALVHAGRGTTSPTTALAAVRRTTTAAGSPSLEQWVGEQDHFRYEKARNIARRALQTSFTQEGRLTFQARRELDRAADLLLTPGARGLSVRVIHYATEEQVPTAQQQAAAVLEYLHQRGVPHARLEIVARPGTSLDDETGRPLPTTTTPRLELELVPTGTIAAAGGAAATETDGWTASPRNRR